jgi:hypothetical protein
MHSLLRMSIGAVAVALASLGVTAPEASAATCTWSGCNGKNPSTYGCTSGATTLRNATSKAGHYIELRYSSKCHTVWVRGTNYAAVRIQAGYVDYYGAWHKQKDYVSPSGSAWSSLNYPYSAWTPMISVHKYERYRMLADGNSWTWINTKDGCPDSVC